MNENADEIGWAIVPVRKGCKLGAPNCLQMLGHVNYIAITGVSMLRRSISMLVMLGYLAGQLAAVPHAHADDPAHKHHSTLPHIHLADLGGVAHEHKHGHGHVHRHESPAAQREDAPHSGRLQGNGDHDDDAVYLPTPVSSTATSGAEQSKLLTAPAILHFVDSGPFIDAASPGSAASLRLRQERAPHCALCLALRALRI